MTEPLHVLPKATLCNQNNTTLDVFLTLEGSSHCRVPDGISLREMDVWPYPARPRGLNPVNSLGPFQVPSGRLLWECCPWPGVWREPECELCCAV